MYKLLLAAIPFFLYGCAQIHSPDAQSGLSTDAASAVGGASIRGTLHRKSAGEVVTCAERPVLLIAEEDADGILKWMEREKRVPTQSDVSATSKNEARFTQCDKNGTFAFQNLPASHWFLVAEVFDGSTKSGIVRFVETTVHKETIVDFEWEDAPDE
jgi:hypothetical protein